MNIAALIFIGLIAGITIFGTWILPRIPIPYDTDLWEGGEPRIDIEQNQNNQNPN